jgi:hypothetical protein
MKMTLKHWFEPTGKFIINIPVDWQYKNDIIEGGKEQPPYSFERYNSKSACFQISSYPISEKGNPNLKTFKDQTNYENWIRVVKEYEDGFEIVFSYSQINDLLLISKYVSELTERDQEDYKEQISLHDNVLTSLRVIPVKDRDLAVKHKAYHNFLGSLMAAYDMRYKAIDNYATIEVIILTSNIIDAYLRLCIVLTTQITSNCADFDVKYLYEGETGKGRSEGKIYAEAKDLLIITDEEHELLNDLYRRRNKVVHRYLISKIRTSDILNLGIEFEEALNLIRDKLKKIEDIQITRKVGLYAVGYTENYQPTAEDRKIAFSMANDKHVLKNFQKKL